MSAHDLPNWHSTFSANAELATSTVHARGDLDLLTVDLLQGAVDVLTRCGHYEITLDLADLEHVDAAGIKLLAALQRGLSADGGGLAIINAAGPVRARLREGSVASSPPAGPG